MEQMARMARGWILRRLERSPIAWLGIFQGAVKMVLVLGRYRSHLCNTFTGSKDYVLWLVCGGYSAFCSCRSGLAIFCDHDGRIEYSGESHARPPDIPPSTGYAHCGAVFYTAGI